MTFSLFKAPNLQARIRRELATANHQLMDAEATAEAAEATVVMLQQRIQRLESALADQKAPTVEDPQSWPSLSQP